VIGIAGIRTVLAWIDITAPDTRSIQSVFFLDSARGWTLSSTTSQPLQLERTTNGGNTWQGNLLPLSVDETDYLSGAGVLYFIDSLHGWVLLRQASSPNVSIGTLFATSDGGITWKRLPNPPVADEIRFTTQTEGWLTGRAGNTRLYVTHDGGYSWSLLQTLTPPNVAPKARVRYSVPVFQDSEGSLIARYTSVGSSVVAFFESKDGGQTWQPSSVLDVSTAPPSRSDSGRPASYRSIARPSRPTHHDHRPIFYHFKPITAVRKYHIRGLYQ
jgi:photosystem II stability/assembly factor-like uncharacterized protein